MKARVLALDLAVMIVCFTGLTLFPAMYPWISRDLGVSSDTTWIVSIAYSIGVFASYLVGSVPSIAQSPKRVLSLSTIAVSTSMALSSLATNAFQLATLRFLQGFASMVVPVFSTQIARSFGKHAPLALGILFGGTFIGGAVGYASTILAPVIGWRATYLIYAIAVAACGATWIKCLGYSLTPRKVLALKDARKLWGDPFTMLWGTSFFTTMWILFTIATLGQQAAPSNPTLFGEALQISMAAWSVIGGWLASTLRSRDSVHVAGKVQQLCLAISALGALTTLSSSNSFELMIGAALLGAVQGASPAFWSLPSAAYPDDEAEVAGFVLGALSNSAAVVGPLASGVVAMSAGLSAMWALLASVSFVGIALTSMAMRVSPPIAMQGGRARVLRR